MTIFASGESWDANENFVLVSSIVLILMQAFLIKKMPVPLIVLIWVFNYFLVQLADMVIAVPPLNLYDIMDSPKFEWSDFFTHLFIYPTIGFLFVYLYQKWEPHDLQIAVYVVFWSLLSVLYEWLAVKFGVFHYSGWKLWWSFFVYIVVFVLNLLFVRKMRSLLEELKKTPTSLG
ncbi:hypothetical protein JJB07_16645 [Tumebacillus sp. ITR2]|uniref:Uncharacterized protein n=1 Tax=Tumebacillus amylolyticus TaxID=2801339 RepID=A0ABS1JDD1_9BACL|nr:hypothetical protein [Tumebacillus amylolyticus]MBL0388244.1 hypothetical protein [Tumebacillus amylolyticus]